MSIAVLLLAAAPLAADAQDSVLARRYQAIDLDELWAGTLGTDVPQVDRFALLAPGPNAPEPTVSGPMPDFGLPFTGVVTGESAGAGGARQTRAFPVIPMTPEDAAVLHRRLAWAEIYLSRYLDYEQASTDTAATLAALTERQYAAGLEAYLVTARLYFSAPDLQAKCLHLTRMDELKDGALSGIEEGKLPADWRPLLPIETATAQRLGGEALASLVCSVEPVRGRAETVELVETQVRERIIAEVRAKVEDTLTLLNASAASFTALVNRMDVLIRSAEILELERVLGNAAANMILVKDDQLRAGETIAQLQAVDLSTLEQPGQLGEFEQGRARMTGMVGVIEAVMTALADLSQAVENPDVATELAPCAALRGAYSALDLNLDTGALTVAINGSYEDCLSRARSVVALFQQPSLKKARMAELARHVRQISETYLSTVSP